MNTVQPATDSAHEAWGALRHTLAALPGRLRRRLAYERAEWRLRRDFATLMNSAPGAYRARSLIANGQKVAFATFGGGNWHLVLEMLLAHALALRGATPELLVCDMPSLPACDERTCFDRDPTSCRGCLGAKRRLLDSSGLRWRGLSAFLSEGALERAGHAVAALRDEDLDGYTHGSWPIGRWIFVSTCHFLRRDARGRETETIAARRAFLTSAIVVAEAVDRWLDDVRPDALVAESGAHFMWRIALELARARGIRVVCREIGKGGFDSHIYSLNAECMFPDWTDVWASAKDSALSDEETERTSAYLASLPAKTYAPAGDEPSAVRTGLSKRELGLRDDGRVAILFTNVTWDLATAGRDVGFDGMFDWMSETMRLAERFPDVQIAVRGHPAERHVLTRDRALDWLTTAWPRLPENVKLIGPDSPIAVRDLCNVADLVLTYCSTTGIEAAIYGRPVLVSGAPHYRGKGFTIDVQSRDHYRDMFAQWTEGGLGRPADASELATRYFHLFFLRYHIAMGWTTSPLEPPFELIVTDLSDLLPGRSQPVDVVCSGVLEGREILLPGAGPARHT